VIGPRRRHEDSGQSVWLYVSVGNTRIILQRNPPLSVRTFEVDNPSVNLSVCHASGLCSTITAEWIDVVFGMETSGNQLRKKVNTRVRSV